MNNVMILGRLCQDVTITQKGEVKYIQNRLAVKRDFKNPDGTYGTDFINIVAFGKTAELIFNHFKKGNRILVQGSINSSQYEKDGQTHFSMNVKVNKIDFIEKKEETSAPLNENLTNALTGTPTHDVSPLGIVQTPQQLVQTPQQVQQPVLPTMVTFGDASNSDSFELAPNQVIVDGQVVTDDDLPF